MNRAKLFNLPKIRSSSYMDEKHFYQTVGATLYPTRIIIETRNYLAQGYTYSTTDISILPSDCTDIVLGNSIAEHLQKSVDSNDNKPDFRELRKQYLKKAKFKSEPATKKDAKFVTIFKTIDSLIFRPYNNALSEGRWSSYLGMPEEVFEIFAVDNYEVIGNAVRKAWSKCIFS